MCGSENGRPHPHCLYLHCGRGYFSDHKQEETGDKALIENDDCVHKKEGRVIKRFLGCLWADRLVGLSKKEPWRD